MREIWKITILLEDKKCRLELDILVRTFVLCCSQHQQVRRQWEQGAALHPSQSAPDPGEAQQSDKGTLNSTVVPNLKSIYLYMKKRY